MALTRIRKEQVQAVGVTAGYVLVVQADGSVDWVSTLKDHIEILNIHKEMEYDVQLRAYLLEQ